MKFTIDRRPTREFSLQDLSLKGSGTGINPCVVSTPRVVSGPCFQVAASFSNELKEEEEEEEAGISLAVRNHWFGCGAVPSPDTYVRGILVISEAVIIFY